jgi:hypothetical protein
MTLYRSKSPSFKDSRSRTPSVISVGVKHQFNSSGDLAYNFTFYLGFRRGAVLEPDGIPNQSTKLAFHLLADTFRDRHGRHAAGLSTANETIGAVPILIQKLCELRGLTRARLTNYDNHYRQDGGQNVSIMENGTHSTLVIADRP